MGDHVRRMAESAGLMAERAEAFAEGKRLGAEMAQKLLGREHVNALAPIVAASLCLQFVADRIGQHFGMTGKAIMLEMADELRTLADVNDDAP